MPTGPTPADLLPLKPVDFLILLVLSEEDRHGYGIVGAIGERTDGRVNLVPGNLYAVLRRMMADGLIEETEERPAAELDDQRRRYYKLTEFGHETVSAEAERMRDLVHVAESLRIIGKTAGA